MRISNLVAIATLLFSLVSPVQASTSYVEALRCHKNHVQEFGEVDAGVLCRGITSQTATAVYNCVSEIRGTMANDALAILCQGISYRISTATFNCIDDAMDFGTPMDAAVLCQRTSYGSYTAKMNCFREALRSMTSLSAAQLCGGITE